jgi:protein-S-isoprenylcysteine O-methyltransferase Ste14
MISPAIRTTLSAVFVLGLLLLYLPWQLLQVEQEIAELLRPLTTYGGGLLFLAGAALTFSGAYYLVRRGEGTPLPFDPPHRLVVAGPYAHLQHPMLLGVLLMAGGQALWVQSLILGLYALLLIALANLYVVYIEEPVLEKRFGADYRAYQAAVPRWFPFPRRRATTPSE